MPDLSNQSMQDIRQHVDTVLAAQAAAAPALAGGPQAAAAPDFCSIWPTAKPILDGISGVIAFIPGFGAAAGAVLKALLSVGDQLYSSTCKKPG